jgi:hypothetical protein
VGDESKAAPEKPPSGADAEVAIALGQVAVALQSISAALNAIQAEMWRRMQSHGMMDIHQAAADVARHVEEAKTAVQRILERAAKDG